MSSDTTNSTATFERMTKEEKLRFCQDLIKQAANLTKSSDVKSHPLTTGNKSNISGVRSGSKSSKRPLSPSGILSKKTKKGTLSAKAKSRIRTKSTATKSSKSHKVRTLRIFCYTCLSNLKIFFVFV